jgi:very-short-patch-repair endonuclease
VVDFYCSEAKLIVEVDGEFHGERYEEDARRTACLERRGYRVLRFQATEILVDLDAVVETLLNELTPLRRFAPPPPRGGEGPSSPDWSETSAGQQ